MPLNRRTFKDHSFAGHYRKLYGNRPLPHENQPKVALLKRLQRKGLLTIFQLRYFIPHHQGDSIPFLISPGLALTMQQHFACEFACDLVIALATRQSFYLTTRGFDGAANSNALCYYLCSPYFLVLPGFHTHEKLENALGKHKPSLADILIIGSQQIDMGSFRLRLAMGFSPPSEGRRRLGNSRWWRHRWRQHNSDGDKVSGYPFVSPEGIEEDLRLRTHCLRNLDSKVYFPNGEFVYYTLRWPGRGYVRQGTLGLWQPAIQNQNPVNISI